MTTTISIDLDRAMHVARCEPLDDCTTMPGSYAQMLADLLPDANLILAHTRHWFGYFCRDKRTTSFHKLSQTSHRTEAPFHIALEQSGNMFIHFRQGDDEFIANILFDLLADYACSKSQDVLIATVVRAA